MQNTIETFEVDKLIELEPSSLKFTKNDSGFLSLNYEGEKFEKVNLTRLIPLMSKNTFISVSYKNKDGDFAEIGIIKDINELDEIQYEIVNTFLEFKYYMPRITKVNNVRDDGRGILIVDVETTAGPKKISIRDWYTNFKLIDLKILYIVDVHGNKYICDDVNTLDNKSLSTIELYA